MTTRDLNPYDDILISGRAGNGKRYSKLPCQVATLSEDGSIKVWCDVDGGKLWFQPENVTAIEITDRNEW